MTNQELKKLRKAMRHAVRGGILDVIALAIILWIGWGLFVYIGSS